MTVDLPKLFLLGVLCTSIHWLLARSEIAKPLWSRAKGWVDGLLRCAGCSGWWLGLIVGQHVQPFEGTGKPLACALTGAFLTPVFEAVMLWGLERSAVPSPDEGEHVHRSLDPDEAHGIAHAIAEELWGDNAPEMMVDKLTVAVLHAFGEPEGDEEENGGN